MHIIQLSYEIMSILHQLFLLSNHSMDNFDNNTLDDLGSYAELHDLRSIEEALALTFDPTFASESIRSP
jgi:hypothetical protein